MRHEVNRHLIKYPTGELASREEISWTLSKFAPKPFFPNGKHLRVAELPIGTKAVFHIHNVVVRFAGRTQGSRELGKPKGLEN